MKAAAKNKKLTLVGMRVKKNVVNVQACIRILKTSMPEKYGNKVELHTPNPLKIVHFDGRKNKKA